MEVTRAAMLTTLDLPYSDELATGLRKSRRDEQCNPVISSNARQPNVTPGSFEKSKLRLRALCCSPDAVRIRSLSVTCVKNLYAIADGIAAKCSMPLQ
jgi:hypothetical protein